MTTKPPRGIRNNNPGNIDRQAGTKWQGMAKDQSSDQRFVVFESPRYGIRAIAKVLTTYQAKHGLNTISEIINRWAPPVENNTNAYADHVATLTGINKNAPIDVTDYEVAAPLVKAIITHENGCQPYDDATINEGLRLAGIEVPLKPLHKSRTLVSQTTAAAAAGTAGVLDALNGATSQLSQLAPMLDVAKWALLGVTLLAIGVTIYARLDDRAKGKA